MIIIVIEFTFLGINIFWALLRAHFNPRLTARAKMSLSWAQNIFMPGNVNPTVSLKFFVYLNARKLERHQEDSGQLSHGYCEASAKLVENTGYVKPAFSGLR